MDDPTVDQLLSRPVTTVSPDATIREAAATLLEHDVGAVVVEDSDTLSGLLTVTDVVAIVRNDVNPTDATVGEWMRTDVITTTPAARLREVAQTMIEHLIHHVPVVDGDDVVGMITTLDLVAYLARSG